MRPPIRSLFLSALVAAALFSPGSAAAAEPPTLGASLSAPFYADQGTPLIVVSRASIVARFTLSVDGDGWAFAPASFILEPGERINVAVTSVGHEPATVSVRGEAVNVTSGTERGALVISGLAYAHKPFSMPWAVLALAALSVGISGAYAILRVYRRRTNDIL